MAEIKFTEDEMKTLKELQDSFNNLVLQLGQLRVEELNLERTSQKLSDAKKKLDVDYANLLDAERKLSAELNVKYGDGVLDPRTGIFTPTAKANQ